MSVFDDGLFDEGVFDDPTLTDGFDTGIFDEGLFDDQSTVTEPPPDTTSNTAATFTYTPPILMDNPTVGEEDHGPAYRLFRHYRTRARGINVWKLVGGTFTDVQPYPTVSVAQASNQSIDADPTYIYAFLGSHVYDNVSFDDAAGLVAAGFATLDLNLFLNINELVSIDAHALIGAHGELLVWQ